LFGGRRAQSFELAQIASRQHRRSKRLTKRSTSSATINPQPELDAQRDFCAGSLLCYNLFNAVETAPF
jgi:hypothetical protein